MPAMYLMTDNDLFFETMHEELVSTFTDPLNPYIIDVLIMKYTVHDFWVLQT